MDRRTTTPLLGCCPVVVIAGARLGTWGRAPRRTTPITVGSSVTAVGGALTRLVRTRASG